MELRGARSDDLAGVVAVMNAVDEVTLGEPDSSEVDVASGWSEAGFDLAHDAVVAVESGQIIGYAEVYDRGDERRELEVGLFVLPAREDTVARPLLDRVLARARELAAPAARLSTWLAVDDPRARFFDAAGFRPQRRLVRMRIDPAGARATEPSDGIEIRPLLPGVDERSVHAVLVAAFERHVRPITASYPRWEESNVHHPDYDPELLALAWADDEPVGAISVFDHGDLAMIRHVGVLPFWRGRGIASALITGSLQKLAARGQRRVDLGVDVEDTVGALRLYESLGFEVVQQLQLYERQSF